MSASVPKPVRSFIGATGVLTPEQVTEDEGVVTVVGDWASSWANGRSSFAFQAAGDKIASMIIGEC